MEYIGDEYMNSYTPYESHNTSYRSCKTAKTKKVYLQLPIALKIDGRLGSIAAEAPEKFKSDTTILIRNRANLRLH